MGTINPQREQKVSDRIQDKLNMIRGGYEVKSNAQLTKRRDHTPITGKKIKNSVQTKYSSKRQGQKPSRIVLIEKKDHQLNDSQVCRQTQNNLPYYQFNKNQSNSVNGRSNILRNNLTRPVISESRLFSDNTNLSNNVANTSGITSELKQLGNKSVLIVKPNQLGMSNQANLAQSRNSKRKMFQNQNKQNRYSLNKETSIMRQSNSKQNGSTKNSKVSAFFRVDNSNNSKGFNESESRMTKRYDNNLSTSMNKIDENSNVSKVSTSLTNKGPSSGMIKMRSSSTRVSRKQEIGSSNTSITKNQSYTGKGKWKC